MRPSTSLPTVFVSHPNRRAVSPIPWNVLHDDDEHRIDVPRFVTPGDLVLHWERDEKHRPTHFGVFVSHHEGVATLVQGRTASSATVLAHLAREGLDNHRDLCALTVSHATFNQWHLPIAWAVAPRPGRLPSILRPLIGDGPSPERVRLMHELAPRLQPLENDGTTIPFAAAIDVLAMAMDDRAWFNFGHSMLDLRSLGGRHDGDFYALVCASECGRAMALAARYAARFFPARWDGVCVASAFPLVDARGERGRRKLEEAPGSAATR